MVFEPAGLEDHFESNAPDRLLDLRNLVGHSAFLPRQDALVVDHHVDLVGAELDGRAHLVELDGQRSTAARKRPRNAGHRHL
jgi:hypothetical protein